MCISFPYRLCASALLLPLLLHQPTQAATDSGISEANDIPETIEAPIVLLGHNPKNHYVIVLPSPQDDQIRSHLARIRNKMAPTNQAPFITQNHLGSYIYVASFTDRHQAETICEKFLKDEFRARVVYFP